VIERVPNFLIAGVANAGTTALQIYLRQHPQIFMSPVKEPTFFGGAEAVGGRDGETVRRHVEHEHATVRWYLNQQGLSARPNGPLDWAEYVQLFDAARNERAIGEASVRYLRLPGAPGAIRERLPGARLIFILRDPAERLYSRYIGSRWRRSALSFADWFANARVPDDEAEEPVDEGKYATHLTRFFALFPREQLRIYLHDDYRANAAAVVRDILEFLQVDPEYPIDSSRRHNEATVPRSRLLHELRRWLVGTGRLPYWIPGPARRALRSFYNRRRPAPDVPMDGADRRMVVDFYREEIVRTSELIERDLSAWLV